MPQIQMEMKDAPLGDVGQLSGLLGGALLKKLSSGEEDSEKNDSRLTEDHANGMSVCKVKKRTQS